MLKHVAARCQRLNCLRTLCFFTHSQLVVEPSGAVGLAAVLSPQFAADARLRDCKRVGVILCGGNVDLGEDFWRSRLPQ